MTQGCQVRENKHWFEALKYLEALEKEKDGGDIPIVEKDGP